MTTITGLSGWLLTLKLTELMSTMVLSIPQPLMTITIEPSGWPLILRPIGQRTLTRVQRSIIRAEKASGFSRTRLPWDLMPPTWGFTIIGYVTTKTLNARADTNSYQRDLVIWILVSSRKVTTRICWRCRVLVLGCTLVWDCSNVSFTLRIPS